MDQHAHEVDGSIPQEGSASESALRQLPTARRVLTHAAWVSFVQVAGVPLFVWWLLDTSTGEVRVSWWPALVLIGYVLLVPGIQRVLRAPRPDLERHAGKQVDWQRAHRALSIVTSSGALSQDRGAHTAAGVLACQDIESAVWKLAYAGGIFLCWFLVPSWAWLALGTFMAVVAATELPGARRGWRYLEILHSDARSL